MALCSNLHFGDVVLFRFDKEFVEPLPVFSVSSVIHICG